MVATAFSDLDDVKHDLAATRERERLAQYCPRIKQLSVMAAFVLLLNHNSLQLDLFQFI